MRFPRPDDSARARVQDLAEDAEARQALHLAQELQQAVRRERETVRRLAEYLGAKAAATDRGLGPRRAADPRRRP